MIIFITMMISILVVVIAWMMLSYNKGKIPADVKDPESVLKNTCWYKIKYVFTVFLIFIILFITIIVSCSNTEAKRLYDESENLSLYVEVINESDNEYLRYNFWNEVHAHNSKVDLYRSMPENIWFGWFIPHPELYENILYVNFSLNGG